MFFLFFLRQPIPELMHVRQSVVDEMQPTTVPAFKFALVWDFEKIGVW